VRHNFSYILLLLESHALKTVGQKFGKLLLYCPKNFQTRTKGQKMSMQTPVTSNELSSFFLVERFNEAMNTQGNDSFSFDCLVKKIASIALLIIVPLNILLLPFIGIWNCFFATKGVQSNLPPMIQIPANGAPVSNSTQALSARFEPYSKIRDGQLVSFKIMGANTLAGMDSPFEFSGELGLGQKADETRARVWEAVTSMASFYKYCPADLILEEDGSVPADIDARRTALIRAAIAREKTYGPTFGELITPEFIASLRRNFPNESAEIDAFVVWVNKFKDVHAFPLLRNYPGKLIAMDKLINDTRSEGLVDAPPTPYSTVQISENPAEAIDRLLGYLARFPKEMKDAKLTEVQEEVANFEEAKLKKLLGDNAVSGVDGDLSLFTRTRFGQKLFHAVYNEENRRLIAAAAQKEGATTTLLQDVNQLKQRFAETLADPQIRANVYLKNIKKHEFGVVFTQEAYQQIIDGLAPNYLPIDRQVDARVGRDCLIFLHRDLWDEDYKVISFEGKYADKDRKHLTMVLAKCKQTGEWFAFASSHGDAGKSEDGRRQLELIKEAFDSLDRKLYPNIQLVVQADANTKTREDATAYQDKADDLDLEYSEMLETCFKQRMATVMNNKVGKFDRNPGDLFLVLCARVGGLFKITHLKIGYKEEQDRDSKLPTLKYPSDHFPISAKLKRYTDAELRQFGVNVADEEEGPKAAPVEVLVL